MDELKKTHKTWITNLVMGVGCFALFLYKQNTVIAYTVFFAFITLLLIQILMAILQLTHEVKKLLNDKSY